jgi:hypothetical protein
MFRDKFFENIVAIDECYFSKIIVALNNTIQVIICSFIFPQLFVYIFLE